MKWEKKVPDKPGYWLRVNAGHSVQLHKVCLGDKLLGKPRAGKLTIQWGWSGETRECLIASEIMQCKMKHFYWYGPLKFPLAEALENE